MSNDVRRPKQYEDMLFELCQSDKKIFPITLRDETGDLNACARYTALNSQSGEWLVNSLKELGASDLFYPIIQNGVNWPYEDKPDTRIYLVGFQDIRVSKSKRNLSSMLSGIQDLFPDSNHVPDLIPIER